MALIGWTEDLSVGIPKIDKQHKKLVDLINHLEELKKDHSDARMSGKAVVEMMNYMNKHFTDEEEMLKVAGYPDYDAHLEEHSKFKESTYNFLDAFKQKAGELSDDLLKFLKDWIVNHIRVVDGKFSEFMAERLAETKK